MPLEQGVSDIEQARFLAQQARDPFPHYEHSHIGYNYRISNILAGIGLALKTWDEVEKMSLAQGITEFGADNSGERLHRK